MNHTLFSGALLLCTLAIVLSPVHAQRSVQQPAEQANWPAEVIVTVGDIRTRVDGPKMWTLSGIDFQNTMMATQDSAYGTVLTIRDVGHLGTAHFLEVPGKPGEIEKEIVSSLKLFVDDKPVTNFKSKMELNGKAFRMERTSKIRGLDLESMVTIRDGVLTETAHFRVTQPIDMQKAHPLMYAWTPEAKLFAFGDDNGVQSRGEFQKQGEIKRESVKNSRWVALFDPVSGKGSVCLLSKRPTGGKAGEEVQFLVIDAPGVYRKVALYTLIDQIVPKGFDGTYQCATGFFTATEKDWEQKAIKRLSEMTGATR